MAFFRTAKFRIKQAVATREELARFNERTAQKVVTEIDPDYLYVVVSGLHGDDPNDNGDYFRWDDELLRKLPGSSIKAFKGGPEYVFQTWVDKPNLLNHDGEKEVGEIVDAWPLQAEKSVDMLLKVSRKHDWLVKGIEDHSIEDVSMGCIVGHSYCSVCDNMAEDESGWCAHLHPGKLNLKGKKYNGEDGKIYASKVGHVCYEDNRDVTGIEVSWITFGEGADSKAERKQILASKGGTTVAKERHAGNAQITFNPDRATEIRDGSAKRVAASAGEAVAVSSSPNPDSVGTALRYYIERFGRAAEKAAIGITGSAEQYNTARDVVAAINDGRLKKSVSIEACVKFGLIQDPDELTPNAALAVLAKAADIDLEHEQVIQDAIDGKPARAQATGGEMGDMEEISSGDQAIGAPEHEEFPEPNKRLPNEPVDEAVTDGEFTIEQPEGGAKGTDMPIVKGKKTRKVRKTAQAGDDTSAEATPHAESGDQAISLSDVDVAVDGDPFPKPQHVEPNEPVDEQVKDGEYKITDSDTSTKDQAGELPYVSAGTNRKLISSIRRYVKTLTASDKAKLVRVATKDKASMPTDHVATILRDIKATCKGARDIRANWPEVHVFLVEATGGDQGALNEEADVADLAVDKVKHEDMPVDTTSRSPNDVQDEATADKDFKITDDGGNTDLPVSKGRKAQVGDNGNGNGCPMEQKRQRMKVKKGPRMVFGPEKEAAVDAPTMPAPAAVPAPTYTAQFVRAEKAPASYWLVKHGAKPILRVVANKAIPDLGTYGFDIDGKTYKGLAAFGSQHYKNALLGSLIRLGAKNAVEQEFGGPKGGFVEVLAQSLPEDIGQPGGMADAPEINLEPAGPAVVDDEVTEDLIEGDDEQSPLMDTLADVLAQMIADNDERTVDEAFDELNSIFTDEKRASEFHGSLEQKVREKEEDSGIPKGEGMEGTDEAIEEVDLDVEPAAPSEIAALRKYRASVERNWPAMESRMKALAADNAKLTAALKNKDTHDRVLVRATRAAQAVERLIQVGYIDDANADEARLEVERLAKLDDATFAHEIGRIEQLAKKLPTITARQTPRTAPHIVTASIPHPAQEAVGVGLTGDGMEQTSNKPYASMWDRPPTIR